MIFFFFFPASIQKHPDTFWNTVCEIENIRKCFIFITVFKLWKCLVIAQDKGILFYRIIPWLIYLTIVNYLLQCHSYMEEKKNKKKLEISKRALLKGTMGVGLSAGLPRFLNEKWLSVSQEPVSADAFRCPSRQAYKTWDMQNKEGKMNMRTKAEFLSPGVWGRGRVRGELKSPHPESYIICMVHNLQGSAMQMPHNVDMGDFRVAVRGEFIYALPANAGP